MNQKLQTSLKNKTLKSAAPAVCILLVLKMLACVFGEKRNNTKSEIPESKDSAKCVNQIK